VARGARYQVIPQARCRTRTDDPFLTITEQPLQDVANWWNLQRLRHLPRGGAMLWNGESAG
jgi:hypothetical protein